MPRTPQPREDGTVDLRIKLPADVAKRLHDAAAERIVGVNLLASLAIAEFVDRLKPIAETELLRPGATRPETPAPAPEPKPPADA